jgi:hypothetical protein
VQTEQKILNGTADFTALSIAKNLIPRMEFMQDMLKDALTCSYCIVAPKRLAEKYF